MLKPHFIKDPNPDTTIALESLGGFSPNTTVGPSTAFAKQSTGLLPYLRTWVHVNLSNQLA